MATYRKMPWPGPRINTQPGGANILCQAPAFPSAADAPDPFRAETMANRVHTACFTGHRGIGQPDADALAHLDHLLAILYARGFRDFLCGGALGFDLYAAERVLEFRRVHADVRLIFCIPCEEQSAKWHMRDRLRYNRLLYLADEIRILSRFYFDGCMQVRNRYMVDRSSICIAYMKRLRGGTCSTVRYAVSQDLIVLNLAVPGAVEEYAQLPLWR